VYKKSNATFSFFTEKKKKENILYNGESREKKDDPS
jgi:hypothetical protein